MSSLTGREVLIAELLGEVDILTGRIEALKSSFGLAEDRAQTIVKALDTAGESYRLAVTTFNNQAKKELGDFVQAKGNESLARTVDEQRVALQRAAEAAFAGESGRRIATLTTELQRHSSTSKFTMHQMLAIVACTTIPTAAITAWAVWLLTHS